MRFPVEELEDNEPQTTRSKGGFVPVPHEVLQQFLNECKYPKSIKIKVINLVQGNNRKEIGEYVLDFVPGTPVRVENGRFVK